MPQRRCTPTCASSLPTVSPAARTAPPPPTPTTGGPPPARWSRRHRRCNAPHPTSLPAENAATGWADNAHEVGADPARSDALRSLDRSPSWATVPSALESAIHGPPVAPLTPSSPRIAQRWIEPLHTGSRPTAWSPIRGRRLAARVSAGVPRPRVARDVSDPRASTHPRRRSAGPSATAKPSFRASMAVLGSKPMVIDRRPRQAKPTSLSAEPSDPTSEPTP